MAAGAGMAYTGARGHMSSSSQNSPLGYKLSPLGYRLASPAASSFKNLVRIELATQIRRCSYDSPLGRGNRTASGSDASPTLISQQVNLRYIILLLGYGWRL